MKKIHRVFNKFELFDHTGPKTAHHATRLIGASCQ